MQSSLPSADYARSKLPKLPTAEERLEQERKREERAQARARETEERARERIRESYKEGMSSFTIFDRPVPESVREEMRALGWVVTCRVYPGGGSDSCVYLFSLPSL